jgi:hypothetical protein
MFHFSKTSKPAPGSPDFLFGYRGKSDPRRQVDHSYPTGAEVKNGRSYMPAPLTCLHGVDRIIVLNLVSQHEKKSLTCKTSIAMLAADFRRPETTAVQPPHASHDSVMHHATAVVTGFTKCDKLRTQLSNCQLLKNVCYKD